MTVVTLTSAEEEIVQAAIATGRYAGTEQVVEAALKLLREQERQRAAFVATLDVAERRVEEEGWIELDDVIAALDADEAEERAMNGASPRAAS